MNRPVLSVIVVSYNNEKQIDKCLDSIVVETKGIPIQLIVIDNASTDNTVKIIQNSKLKYPSNELLDKQNQIQSSKFITIENKENQGYSKAVNQGFKLAEGEAVLLLNADTILTKGCLETLLDFEEEYRPAIVGPKLLNLDGTVQSSVFHLPTVFGAIKEYWLGRVGAYSKYTPPGNQPVKVEAVLGGAMLISREIVEKVGGFNEKYFMYFEDLDYCRKVSKAGYPIYYLPAAKIIHEHGASGKDLADKANQWRRLIPSSKIYHGKFGYNLINIIIRIGQKFRK